jgi:pyocin large subunit-like protein
MRVVFFSGAAIALGLGLAACGGHPSAVSGASTAASSSASSGPSAYQGTTQASLDDKRRAPVPIVNGKPMWAPNRKHTAEENAEYQFTRNGGDFGASTEADYVTKAHAFVDRPPARAETLDRRNGDRLIYDAKTNVFAVVSRDGAPRTMFKPRDGAAYWAEQKDRESKRDKTGGDSSNQS